MTLTTKNIEYLITLCKNGNQLAQLEIYNRYYKAMYNSSLRIVKESAEAEDIMQESFLQAFTKLDMLKDVNTFSAWLKRIVINNSIYSYKKKNKQNETSLNDVEYKLEDENQSFSEEDCKTLKITEVVTAINSLKDNYKLALTLYLIEGYDHEEISEIMNISYANCRTTVSRAKSQLKEKLCLNKG